MSNGLVVTAQGDLEIVMQRSFNAPRHLVFEAMTKPEFLRRWLGALEGWEWTECEFDPRPGGKYRYAWKHVDGATMGIGGTVLEVSAPERMVQSEKFDDAWFPGESILTTTYEEVGGRTDMTVTLRYETKEARDGVLKSPMEDGVALSYSKLAELVEAM